MAMIFGDVQCIVFIYYPDLFDESQSSSMSASILSHLDNIYPFNSLFCALALCLSHFGSFAPTHTCTLILILIINIIASTNVMQTEWGRTFCEYLKRIVWLWSIRPNGTPIKFYATNGLVLEFDNFCSHLVRLFRREISLLAVVN